MFKIFINICYNSIYCDVSSYLYVIYNLADLEQGICFNKIKDSKVKDKYQTFLIWLDINKPIKQSIFVDRYIYLGRRVLFIYVKFIDRVLGCL